MLAATDTRVSCHSELAEESKRLPCNAHRPQVVCQRRIERLPGAPVGHERAERRTTASWLSKGVAGQALQRWVAGDLRSCGIQGDWLRFLGKLGMTNARRRFVPNLLALLWLSIPLLTSPLSEVGEGLGRGF